MSRCFRVKFVANMMSSSFSSSWLKSKAVSHHTLTIRDTNIAIRNKNAVTNMFVIRDNDGVQANFILWIKTQQF